MATTTAPGAAASRPLRREASAPRPRLQLVRDGGRLRPGLIGTVIISLVFSTLFVLAVLQAVLVQGQLKLDQIDREIRDRTAEKARREVAVATAESPDRIQAEAAAHGLVSPPDVVFLERATVETLPPSSRAVTLNLDAPSAVPSTGSPAAAGPAAGAGAPPATAAGAAVADQSAGGTGR